MFEVVIVQEYVPEYRVPFFELLHEQALESGINLRIAFGSAGMTQQARNDGRALSFGIFIQQHEFALGSRRVVLRKLNQATRGVDLIILEQARRNFDVYRLLSPLRRRSPKIALWGHGRDYTKPSPVLDRLVQRALTLRSDWFFAYTQGGVDAIFSMGYDRANATVVQNSIDTSSLRKSVASISTETVSAFNQRFDLRGRTGLYMGALDESKRLSFLFEAAEAVHRRHPDFRLLVAGDGPLRDWVISRAGDYPWITYLGAITGEDKAVALASVQVLTMPGRVGLVAVDSFAAGTPIVTTDWQWHAPEFEYLTNMVNAVVARDTSADYAHALSLALDNPGLMEQMRAACFRSSDEITIAAMSANFLDGIKSALEGTTR